MHGNETGLDALAQKGTGAPCGHCRQWLAEYVDAPELLLLGTASRTASHEMEDIFPSAFGPAALNNSCPLLSSQPGCQRHRLPPAASHDSSAGDPLVEAALAVAHSSYTPYSRKRSGVALQLEDGQIFAAGAFESVAFNPSVQPVVAALVKLVAAGQVSSNLHWASQVCGHQHYTRVTQPYVTVGGFCRPGRRSYDPRPKLHDTHIICIGQHSATG